jgi:transcriptional regulator with PAS, ATPase and Fis domain
VTLLESELFGYKKGAFTDARTNKPGKFELADEGTIFLDEIGEIPWSIQAKLLRVLEEFAFEPLGSIETVRVNVRLIAATNRDLQKAMEQGVFRKDLYYRLNVFSIRLPALRERKDDIPLLVTSFVEYFNEVSDKVINSVSKASMDLLCEYEWPGNVRQLRHALEYAFIYCKGAVIQPEHLPEEITRKLSNLSDILDEDNPREEIERRMILEALKKYGFRRSRVAKILRMSRTTLWRKIKKYKLQ